MRWLSYLRGPWKAHFLALDSLRTSRTHAASSRVVETYVFGRAPNTERAYRQDLERLARLASDGTQNASEFPWWKIDQSTVSRLKHQLMRSVPPRRVNHALTVLRGVIHTCWELKLLSTDDLRRISIKNLPFEKLPAGRWMEPEEIARLFAACEGRDARSARDGALLALFYGTGARLAEVSALDLSDYNARSGRVLIRSGKGRKDRAVTLAPEGREVVEQWFPHRGPDPGPFVTALLSNGEPTMHRLHPQSISKVLNRIASAADVSRFTPHDLRRASASHLLQEGVDLFLVAKRLGHRNLNTTRLYDVRPDSAEQAAAESLHWKAQP